MPARPTPTPRVGGQALPDGVLMRAGRHWAVARADGTITVGRLPAGRLSRVPVVRVVASLVPALGVGLRSMAGGRRRSGLLLASALVATGFLTPAIPGASGVGGQLGLALVTLAALRLLAPRSLWRYHGAEHKAVAAHEAGVDVDDVDSVLAFSRVHARCGTNLVALVIPATAFLSGMQATVQVIGGLAAIGIAAEVLALAGRRPAGRPARALLLAGRALQRWITTSEPSRDEQAVACRALRACLDAADLAVEVETLAVPAIAAA